MSVGMILPFVATIVGACILGGTIYAGLVKVAESIDRFKEKE